MYPRTRINPAREAQVWRWRKGCKEIAILAWREKQDQGWCKNLPDNQQSTSLNNCQWKWMVGWRRPPLPLQNLSTNMHKGPPGGPCLSVQMRNTCHHNLTSPSEESLLMPISTLISTLTGAFHFPSPYKALFYPKALGQEKSNFDKISTWLLLRSLHGRRGREDFGQSPGSLSMRSTHWGTQRGKGLEEERGCCRCRLCTPDWLFNPW